MLIYKGAVVDFSGSICELLAKFLNQISSIKNYLFLFPLW